MNKFYSVFAAVLIGGALSGITDISMFTVILWAIMAMIPAYIAEKKGRSFVKWYFYAWLIWPVAFVHSLFIKKNSVAMLNSGEYKKCPQCAELIKKEALICRYCQFHFTE